ncbi:hypothetical protein ACVWZW_001631 [Bradyrhizobium sp. F1.13.4]
MLPKKYSQAAMEKRIPNPKVRAMAMSVNLAFDDVSGAASPICSKAFITPPPRDREKRQPGGKQFVPKAVELITGNASVNETIRRFREALTKHCGVQFPLAHEGISK